MKKFLETLNKILTVLSILMIMFWCWKFFGPGGSRVRAAMSGSGFGLRRLFFMSLAGCCIAYLVWRGFSYYYTKKYKLPDDEE